jgi:hypothetical protein
MAAYAKDGNVICYFQNAGKFKARYQMLGFNDRAKLDDGAMWPNSYALMKLTASEEAKITALVKKPCAEKDLTREGSPASQGRCWSLMKVVVLNHVSLDGVIQSPVCESTSTPLGVRLGRASRRIMVIRTR